MMRTTAFSLILVSFATTAFAQDGAPTAPKISPECRQQVETLCPRGGDPKARRDCIIANRDKISPDCAAQLKARQDAMRQWRQEHPGERHGDHGAGAAPTSPPVTPPAPPQPAQ